MAFTLITKIILFPISALVQKNSIAMVKITPQINRLKIKYYGDKDTIADETQVLYKKEHYHPLASLIPMVVQLVMLLGVIEAVKVLLGNADTALTAIPYEAGGLTFIMPVLAGAAALLLGLSQNKHNPLQKEQSAAEQWSSNGFSIAISLFLGAFVSLGVGIYWIASNLMSILQQVVLNLVINPKKYIDYDELEKSKKELAEIEALRNKVSPEDKKREKADYKRFFSVANKKIVFYSEKSGFYKYFKDVIEYLLAKSSVIIHYVTNDPKDQIFDIAKDNPRIKPYYIGENKLITLMMKMDADIVVMTCPDINNYHIKRSYVRKDIEYIYMFHYPLSTHMVLHTGALDHYDTIFCVGDFQFDEIRAQERVYKLPEKKLIAAGYGQLEQLYEKYTSMQPVKREKPKVLIAPSWQYDNILDSCLD
ncbi:MAG: YidC/Oxa1 family membrane protein insertase, partial [Clostridia bacterium]|nr:YidC/Oxa1 family membrane protein insertase [Clostridia bacterium]